MPKSDRPRQSLSGWWVTNAHVVTVRLPVLRWCFTANIAIASLKSSSIFNKWNRSQSRFRMLTNCQTSIWWNSIGVTKNFIAHFSYLVSLFHYIFQNSNLFFFFFMWRRYKFQTIDIAHTPKGTKRIDFF